MILLTTANHNTQQQLLHRMTCTLTCYKPLWHPSQTQHQHQTCQHAPQSFHDCTPTRDSGNTSQSTTLINTATYIHNIIPLLLRILTFPHPLQLVTKLIPRGNACACAQHEVVNMSTHGNTETTREVNNLRHTLRSRRAATRAWERMLRASSTNSIVEKLNCNAESSA